MLGVKWGLLASADEVRYMLWCWCGGEDCWDVLGTMGMWLAAAWVVGCSFWEWITLRVGNYAEYVFSGLESYTLIDRKLIKRYWTAAKTTGVIIWYILSPNTT
jgi:hypothetical protein